MFDLADFDLIADARSLEAYFGLRKDCGLSQTATEQGAGALAGSWSYCHIRERETGRAVAMGRAIGDGGWCFDIADMAALAQFQGRGLDLEVPNTLVAQVSRGAPDNPYITFLAAPPGRRL